MAARKVAFPKVSYKELPPPRELYRIGMGLSALAAMTRRSKFSIVNQPSLWMFKLDRGNGDELQMVSKPAGVLVRGFDHESPRSPYRVGHVWPGTYDGVPDGLRSLIEIAPDKTFDGDLFGDAPGKSGRFPAYTFVAWALPGENEWRRGKLADGAPDSGESFLVGCLDPSIDFENMDATIVDKALRNAPLTDAEIKRAIKPPVQLAQVRERLEYFGYGKPAPFA